MQSKFSKPTDTPHQVTLESHLLYAIWRSHVARIGRTAFFEVGTSLVGFGAPLEIEGLTESGKALGKLSAKMKHNKLVGEFPIPDSLQSGEKIYYKVRLPQNSLAGESNRIVALLPIGVTNLKWSTNKTKRGDMLTLSADVSNAENGQVAEITIYLHDEDGVHRKLTTIPCTVQANRLRIRWEHQYFDPTIDILSEEELTPYGCSYQPPRYFFTVTIDDQEFGNAQESGLLEFRDWLKVKLLNCTDRDRYVLHLPDGSTREGRFTSEGLMQEDDIPPGKYSIDIINDGE